MSIPVLSAWHEVTFCTGSWSLRRVPIKASDFVVGNQSLTLAVHQGCLPCQRPHGQRRCRFRGCSIFAPSAVRIAASFNSWLSPSGKTGVRLAIASNDTLGQVSCCGRGRLRFPVALASQHRPLPVKASGRNAESKTSGRLVAADDNAGVAFNRPFP